MKKKQGIEGKFCPKCAAEDFIKEGSAESGNVRYRCRSCSSRTTRPLSEPPQVLPKFSRQKSKFYIITSAVNDIGVDEQWLKTLENMSVKTEARLIVIATCYENPDATSARGKLKSYTWPESTLPYICQERFQINKNLVLRADARIKHTAINPLQGANHAGGSQSEIFGHAQMGLEVIAGPKDHIPKCIITTGTISKLNFGGSWTAQKAKFHHVYSALFIEVVGSKFWITQVSWDGKGAQLYNRYYTPSTSRKGPQIEAVMHGDIHRDQQTKKEKANTDLMAHGLKAKRNFLPDVLDFQSGSHHKVGNVLENLRRPNFDVRAELDRAVKFIKSIPNAVVVASNHHDHLDKWFNKYDARRADQNIELYADLMNLARSYSCGLFDAYCKDKGVTCDFTNHDKEYSVKGVDCAQHGDIGTNGSRGSAKGFSRTGRKTFLQHTHTPTIHKGAWQVGTSAMGMKYAKGYSSWLVCHGLIYASGKRALIFIIDDKLPPMLLDAINNKRF